MVYSMFICIIIINSSTILQLSVLWVLLPLDRDLETLFWIMLLVLVLRPLSSAATTMEWAFTTVVTLKMLESSAQVSDAYKDHIIMHA